MCGICGVIQLGGEPREVIEQSLLDHMTDVMTHRRRHDDSRDSSRRSGPPAGSGFFSSGVSTGSSARPLDCSAAIEIEPAPEPTAQRMASAMRRFNAMACLAGISEIQAVELTLSA